MTLTLCITKCSNRTRPGSRDHHKWKFSGPQKKKKQNNNKTKQKQQFCGCLKTQTSKTQPSGPKNSYKCRLRSRHATKQLNFGDTLNIIFVISVGIFRLEPFYFFRQIQDTKRYFRGLNSEFSRNTTVCSNPLHMLCKFVLSQDLSFRVFFNSVSVLKV